MSSRAGLLETRVEDAVLKICALVKGSICEIVKCWSMWQPENAQMAHDAHQLLPQLPKLLAHSLSAAAQEPAAAASLQALQSLPLRHGDAPLPPWASRPAGLAWWRAGGSGGAGAAENPETSALLAVLGPGGELAVVDVAPTGRQDPGAGPAPGLGSALAPTDLLRPPLAQLGAGACIAAAPGAGRLDCAEGLGNPAWGPEPSAAGRRARLFLLAAGGRGGAAGLGPGWRLLALEERGAAEAVRAAAARGEWDAALRLASAERVSADAVHQCARRPCATWCRLAPVSTNAHAAHCARDDAPCSACTRVCSCAWLSALQHIGRMKAGGHG